MAFSSAGGDLEADRGATGVVVRETKEKETGAQMVADSTFKPLFMSKYSLI